MNETGVWVEDDGTVIVRKTQDVTPILDHNKALANHDDGYSRSREMRRVASIPLVVIEQWRAEGFDLLSGNFDRKELRRRLNDSDNRFFRTAPGRV